MMSVRYGQGGEEGGADSFGGNMGYLRNGVSYGPGALSAPDVGGLASFTSSGNGGLGGMGMPPLDDAAFVRQNARISGLDGGMGFRSVPARQVDVPRKQLDSLPLDASSTLFVEGIPLDCSRREAAHIFRPFIGFKEVRLVLKDVKRVGVEKVALCFVEFADARCAAIALEALQGYKFDESNPQSQSLRIVFAKNPAPRPHFRSEFDFRGRR